MSIEEAKPRFRLILELQLLTMNLPRERPNPKPWIEMRNY